MARQHGVKFAAPRCEHGELRLSKMGPFEGPRWTPGARNVFVEFYCPAEKCEPRDAQPAELPAEFADWFVDQPGYHPH